MSKESTRWPERLARFLVRLFPFDFRADHGEEIEQVFREQRREAERQGGRAGLWRLWAEFLGGVFQTAPREHLSTLRQDAGYALRRMRQSPAFTGAVVLTLALGIGANTAIFSVVNGVLLRPLPYGEGERLLRLRQEAPRLNLRGANFSEKEILDYRSQNRTLDGLVEYHSMVFILIGEEPHRVQTGVVSPEFFDFFGVRPLHGRVFRGDDDRPESAGVLVLSYPFWQRAFGGDPQVVGRVLRMNNRPHTVVGILPPLPQYPDENDVYMPVSHCPFRSAPGTRQNRNARMSSLFGRVKPGIPAEQAGADLATIARRLKSEYPDSYPADDTFRVTVHPLKQELTQRARPTLLILLATAGFVLLIACANVANLVLSRMVSRERELAIRAAMGANRGRLVRQLLTECTMMALGGGAAGLLLAWAGLDFLVRFAARFTPRTGEIGLDASVLGFTLAASLLTGMIFGALPALSVGGDLVHSLKEGGSRAPAGSLRHRTRSLLVVTQVALSLVLLAGAGLMLRSFYKLLQVHPGFNPENVLAARMNLSFSKYSDPDVRKAQAKHRALYEGLFRQLEGQPGIVAKAAASTYPMMPEATPFDRPIQIEGRPVPEGQPAPRAELRTITPEYFRAMGIPLLRGRLFDDRDTLETPRVAIVSQAMARHHWGEADPLGQRIGFGNPAVWREIVGVVGDVKEYGPGRDAPLEIYQPFAQDGFVGRVLIRTTNDPLLMAGLLRRAAREVDPDLAVDQFRTLEQARGEAVAAPRLTTLLLSIFGGLALVITATGIAGVLALVVSHRTQEIGIRMALGATPWGVMGMVLRQGMRLVVAGLALGTAGALALTRALSDMVFGVEPHDPAAFAAAALVLAGVAVAACLLPARRAAVIDPVTALRAE